MEEELDVECGQAGCSLADDEVAAEVGDVAAVDQDAVCAEATGGCDVYDGVDGGVAEVDSVDVEAMVAEAEQRGYLRGRNERIEELMRLPSMMEALPTRPVVKDGGDSGVMILNNPRVSIWDR